MSISAILFVFSLVGSIYSQEEDDPDCPTPPPPPETVSCDLLNEESLCEHFGGSIEQVYCYFICRKPDGYPIFQGTYPDKTPCQFPNGRKGECQHRYCKFFDDK